MIYVLSSACCGAAKPSPTVAVAYPVPTFNPSIGAAVIAKL